MQRRRTNEEICLEFMQKKETLTTLYDWAMAVLKRERTEDIENSFARTLSFLDAELIEVELEGLDNKGMI